MLQKAPEITGLTAAQVARIQEKDHSAHLPLRSNRTYWEIIRTNVFNAYNLILVASCVLVLFLKGSKDVVVALILVLTNIGLGLFQEIKAKRTLDKLATLQTRTIHVRRDGKNQEIPLTELVHGDVVVLFPGEPVVADGQLLYSDGLELDESSLTGESESVAKQIGSTATSGSYCLAGFGLMTADKVGSKSSLYELTEKAKSFRTSSTELEKWLKKIFQLLLYIILILGPLTFISGLNQGYTAGQTLANVVNLVSSLIPQGMIVSMTILFALGVVNMSKYHTLVQRVNAVAIMGAITVLCADKTGTLTTNQLKMESILPLGARKKARIESDLREFAEHISWANKTIQAIATHLTDAHTAPANLQKIFEVPFSSERKWSGLTLSNETDAVQTLILGAPEMLTTDPKILEEVKTLAQQGFRVVAFAISSQTLTEEQHLPKKLELVALLTFQEQLRLEVKDTVSALAKQHIQLKIISGDSAETLRAIAAQLKLPAQFVYEQTELENLDPSQFSKKIKQGQFFARITPQMKELIISELVAQGETVAMVGDGVNDVRALKKSHVAIAVNEGTQVTKDVADIILLDNSFASLPKSIDEGRDITQRVYAIAKIFFVKVIYLITLFLLAGFASFAFPISLRQTTWLGFIVVGIPTGLITFKFLNPNPTKSIRKNLIQYTITAGVIGGLVMALITIITQLIFQNDVETSRTQVSLFASFFSTFVLLQVHGINIFSLASMRKRLQPLMIILGIGAVAILFPSRFTPRVFESAHLDHMDWLVLAFGIAGSITLLRFLLKRVASFVEANGW